MLFRGLGEVVKVVVGDTDQATLDHGSEALRLVQAPDVGEWMDHASACALTDIAHAIREIDSPCSNRAAAWHPYLLPRLSEQQEANGRQEHEVRQNRFHGPGRHRNKPERSRCCPAPRRHGEDNGHRPSHRASTTRPASTTRRVTPTRRVAGNTGMATGAQERFGVKPSASRSTTRRQATTQAPPDDS